MCCYDVTIIFILTEFDSYSFIVQFFMYSWLIASYYMVDEKEFIKPYNDENMVVEIVESKHFGFTEITCTFFSLIFAANMLGMTPYSHTVTSQIMFTIILGMIIMFIIWLQAFYKNKIIFINHFLPNGAPLLIAPFIILIEIISNLSRVVSLPVRIFANMTAGHTLLKIIANFGLLALSLVFIFKSYITFSMVFLFVLTILEILIAFIQTYVFITLIIIYISEQE